MWFLSLLVIYIKRIDGAISLATEMSFNNNNLEAKEIRRRSLLLLVSSSVDGYVFFLSLFLFLFLFLFFSKLIFFLLLLRIWNWNVHLFPLIWEWFLNHLLYKAKMQIYLSLLTSSPLNFEFFKLRPLHKILLNVVIKCPNFNYNLNFSSNFLIKKI